MECSSSLLVQPCRQASQERNTDRTVRDTRATVRRERQRSLRSKCRSLGRHWCAKTHEHPLCFLASSAPTSAVTGQRSTLLQAICVPTAISTNKSREHSTAQPFFLGWEAGANALASRAQGTCHEFMTFSSSSYRSGVRESNQRDLGFDEHVDWEVFETKDCEFVHEADPTGDSKRVESAVLNILGKVMKGELLQILHLSGFSGMQEWRKFGKRYSLSAPRGGLQFLFATISPGKANTGCRYECLSSTSGEQQCGQCPGTPLKHAFANLLETKEKNENDSWFFRIFGT